MSEREVRLFAKELAGWRGLPGERELCKALLDEPPDLAVLLREMEERVGLAHSRFHATFASNSREQLRGILAALDSLQDYIEEQFGIRLTEDGWEYTEGE